MPCAITMKDTLITEVVDENFPDLMLALNASINRGGAFISVDDMEGGQVMFNIPNIMTVKELQD